VIHVAGVHADHAAVVVVDAVQADQVADHAATAADADLAVQATASVDLAVAHATAPHTTAALMDQVADHAAQAVDAVFVPQPHLVHLVARHIHLAANQPNANHAHLIDAQLSALAAHKVCGLARR
jgi:hypothetical protein